MKKYLLILMAALFAVVSCNKEPVVTPDVDSIEILSDAQINAEAGSSIVQIKIKAGAAWTADVIDANGPVTDYAVLDKKSGEKGEHTLKLTIQSLPEEEEGRLFHVSFRAGHADAVVDVCQGMVFKVAYLTENWFKPAGGTFRFQVYSNYEYVVAEQTETWATVTKDGNIFTVEIQENKGYDSRMGYVHFTIAGIQDPVIDPESGEPTGETAAREVDVRFFQEGNMTETWNTRIPDAMNDKSGAAVYRLAKFQDYLAVSTGASIHLFDPATGEYKQQLDLTTFGAPAGTVVTGITNDDAGNLVFSVGGEYTYGVYVYVVNAKNPTSFDINSPLIYWPNSIYGYGINNVRARGDLLGEGIVTMYQGGAPAYGGVSYCAYWKIGSGMATWTKNESDVYVTVPTYKTPSFLTANLWNSNSSVFYPIGTKPADGFLFNGYVGDYNWRATTDFENWQVILETGSSWIEGYNCIDIVEWNGKTVAGFIGMSFFPYWSCPSYFWLVDMSGNLISKVEYLADGRTEGAQFGESSDVILEVNTDGSLDAYLIDGEQICLRKFNYPVLK